MISQLVKAIEAEIELSKMMPEYSNGSQLLDMKIPMGFEGLHHLASTYISSTPFSSYSPSAAIIPDFSSLPRPFEQPGESLGCFPCSASLGKLLLNLQSPAQPSPHPGIPPGLHRAPLPPCLPLLKPTAEC